MNEKLLIILIAVISFTAINLLLKLLGYSFKAKKHGAHTNATIIGYYMYNDISKIMWYPVVKFNKLNGEEVIAQNKAPLAVPVYKIGETISIQYYANDTSNIKYKNVHIDKNTKIVEKMYIDDAIKFNIIDFKHLLDIILEVIFFAIILIFTLYK